MEQISIYPCGTMASPKLHPVPAIITQAAIRFNEVRYELSYFHEGKEETVWMSEKQFTVSEGSEKIKIGYK